MAKYRVKVECIDTFEEKSQARVPICEERFQELLTRREAGEELTKAELDAIFTKHMYVTSTRTQPVVEQVYEQTVDELDVREVILAVNGLPPFPPQVINVGEEIANRFPAEGAKRHYGDDGRKKLSPLGEF